VSDDKTTEQLRELIKDAVKRAHMRRNFSDRKVFQAHIDGYLQALGEVWRALDSLPISPHDRFKKQEGEE
jgi:hypothetical protein